MLFKDSKFSYNYGVAKYIRHEANVLSAFLQLSFFVAYGFKFYAWIVYGHDLTERRDWPADHPTLLAEAFFAVGTVVSFLRFFTFYTVNRTLGPLQISFSFSIVTMIKCLSLMLLMIHAFAFGLTQLFSSSPERKDSIFSSYGSSLFALQWFIYSKANIPLSDIKGQQTTQTVAFLILALYHMVVVIVVSKLVISALQIALAKVKGNEDTEWKFAKTSLIISYLNTLDVLPPPFNLLPCSKYQSSSRSSDDSQNCSTATYLHTINTLIRRYRSEIKWKKRLKLATHNSMNGTRILTKQLKSSVAHSRCL